MIFSLQGGDRRMVVELGFNNREKAAMSVVIAWAWCIDLI